MKIVYYAVIAVSLMTVLFCWRRCVSEHRLRQERHLAEHYPEEVIRHGRG